MDRFEMRFEVPMMKCVLIAAMTVCLVHGVGAETIKSPSGEIQLTIDTSAGLTYSITAFGEPVIVSSPIRMSCDGWADIGGAVTMTNVTTNSSDTTWTPVVPGRRAVIRDHYNEMTYKLVGAGDGVREFLLRARAYDDGVAFRCELPGQPSMTNLVGLSESTEFRFPTEAHCWAANYGSYVSHQEAKFEPNRLSAIGTDAFVGMPLVVELNSSLYVAVTEAAVVDHAGMYFKRKSGEAGQPVTLVNHLSGIVNTTLPHNAPWRMFMIARKPVKFLENDMLLNLNEACDLTDTSWIKPGMMAWDHWWSGDVKMDTATIKEYIQLAADMGWPYQLIDWQWYGDFDKTEADITKVNPAVDMPEVLRFAKEKGVKCWLWLYWTDVERNDAYLKAFPLYEEWGIAGVKIDFMQRDDQWMVNWYHKIIRSAAEHHLMVDFHGAYKPTGERRTLPNMVTREGVLGNEWNKWEPKTDPEHKCTLALTRNLLGEMDFTPGGFRNRAQGHHADGGGPARVPGTRAQELALFVVYESPMTCACDSPESYKDQPGVDFLKQVPTTWDETIGIDGRIGDFVVVAKRKRDDWFLGAMTDWDARALTVPLDFLGKRPYVATVWRDAEDSHINAEHLVIETNMVWSGDSLQLFLSSGGGAVVRFRAAGAAGTPATPPTTWMAYNDLAWQAGQRTANISMIGPAGSSVGTLRDVESGLSVPVRVTFSGEVDVRTGAVTNPPAESPAGQVFNSRLDSVGYAGWHSGSVSLRFDGLTPGQRYAFVLFGSRGFPEYTNRWTDVQIVGARKFVNKSGPSASISKTARSDDTARVSAANMDGTVWDFRHIVPAKDGHIEFIATAGGNGSTGGYINAFMLLTEMGEEWGGE